MTGTTGGWPVSCRILWPCAESRNATNSTATFPFRAEPGTDAALRIRSLRLTLAGKQMMSSSFLAATAAE